LRQVAGRATIAGLRPDADRAGARPARGGPLGVISRGMRDWNATRFDPASDRGHVESHFLKLNDGEGRRALWLKATILRRLGEPAVAESWAIAFDRERGHVAAKEVVPWTSASFSREQLAIAVARVALEPARTRGAVGAGDRRIEWELAFAG